MSSSAFDYYLIFQTLTPGTGRFEGFSLSPNGSLLLCSTDDGHVTLVDTVAGDALSCLNMGTDRFVTALLWATDDWAVLGCKNGAVYLGQFHPSAKVFNNI
jgi:hypothetical protein